MLINKDTKIYGSFSSAPGNNGCTFFNELFVRNNINAIYKSFYSDNIVKSVESARTLGFGGFAVSMPFKFDIINCIDEVSEDVHLIQSCNTVVNENGTLRGYNTDWYAIYNYLMLEKPKFLSIVGNGGFSKAAQFACNKLGIPYQVIGRSEWSAVGELEGYIFNATPMDVITKGRLIDGRPFTQEGKILARLQAEEQYKLYIKYI
jgi:shikimate dehydrogenase